MTHNGVVNAMKILVASYPSYKPEDMASTIQVWEGLLQDYSDAEVARALKAYILTDGSGFAPSIGRVVAIIKSNPNELGELEAWGMVSKAIRNGNYGAEEEFQRLPDTVKEAVGSPGQIREWASMPSETVQSVAQSNFLRAYRVAAERASKAVRVPVSLKGIYQRTRLFPELEVREEEPKPDGVPMTDEARRKLQDAIVNGWRG